MLVFALETHSTDLYGVPQQGKAVVLGDGGSL